MTRLPLPHPFQPAWRSVSLPRLRAALEVIRSAPDEPGLLECMAVFGAALSLIVPAWIWGGW